MPRPLLDSDTIYEAALGLIEGGETGALTARNLASTLRCSTRTLYKQVGKQEQLITSLLDYYFRSKTPSFPADQSWQTAILKWSCELREVILARPNLAAHLTPENHAAIAGYTKPMLTFLIKAGFDPVAAAEICKSLAHVVISLAHAEFATQKYPAPALADATAQADITALLYSSLAEDQAQTDPALPTPNFLRTVEWLVKGIEAHQPPALEAN
jgi:AcrR family transcriptional regulator